MHLSGFFMGCWNAIAGSSYPLLFSISDREGGPVDYRLYPSVSSCDSRGGDYGFGSSTSASFYRMKRDASDCHGSCP